MFLATSKLCKFKTFSKQKNKLLTNLTMSQNTINLYRCAFKK